MNNKCVVTLIASGKGGVGKTTTTANLGQLIAHNGKRVCLIDLDVDLCNLDLLLGIERKVVFGISDILLGNCGVSDALVQCPSDKNLYALPATSSEGHIKEMGQQIAKTIECLSEQFDYILLDCPAGIGEEFAIATAVADNAIIVVNPEVSSMRDADKVISMLESYGFDKHNGSISIMVTRYQEKMSKKGDMLSLEDIQDTLGYQYIGVIPEDRNTVVSTNKGRPLVTLEDSKAKDSYEKAVVNYIQNRRVNAEEFKTKTGFFGKLFASESNR